MESERNPVLEKLRLRGFSTRSHNPSEYLFFPPDQGEPFEDELYQMLKKYSFRLFVRDVIKKRKSFCIDDLLKYSSREWVERYVEFLHERGVVEETQGGWRLTATEVFSFGDTLEWFVARAFERELGSPALWGVRLAGVEAGGDYDVVALVDGRLCYVEVKSSPPKNVEGTEVAAFLRRAEALRPDMAVFLEDTRLRMKDKIVPLFEEELKGLDLEVRRLRDETFAVGKKLYITNSRPEMITNISYCVSRYLLPESFLGYDRQP